MTIFGKTAAALAENEQLRRENDRLRERVEFLESHYQEVLTFLYEKTPIGRKTEVPVTPKHSMKKGDSNASCSCGWHVVEQDPIKLQQEISKHFRQNAIPGGRKSWAQQRNILETAGE